MVRVPVIVETLLALAAGALAAGASPPAGALALAVAMAAAIPRRTRLAALGALLGFSAGARARSPPAGDSVARRLPADGARVVVEGDVASADPPAPRGQSLVLDVDRWRTGAGEERLALRLSVFVLADEAAGPIATPFPGDRVRAWGIAVPLAPPTNPGAYDALAAGERRGIVGRLDVPDPRGLEVLRRAEGPLVAIAEARNVSAAGFDAALSADDSGLLRSLLLGDRGALSAADRRRFRDAGASHVLAISGAHVALLVAGLLWALRRAGLPPHPTAAVAVVAVLAFVPFSGSASPVLRSAAGFLLFLVGRVLGREPSGGVLLAAVAVTFLVVDPDTAMDPGARMSFAAAAGMILLAGRFHRLVVPERPVFPGITVRPRAPVRAALAAGTAAWLASTPVAAHDLGQVSWVAVPVGVVAVPASTLVMALGAVTLLFAPWSAASHALAEATALAVAGLRWFLDLPRALGVETGPSATPDLAWSIAYVAAAVALARGRAVVATLGGVLVALLLSGLAVLPPHEPPADVTVTLLDVGHGQAALVEAPDGQTALLDAGSRDRPEPASRIVLPALRALHVASLTVASASHADADHSGALAEVLETVPAGTAAVPPRFPAAIADRFAATGAAPLVAADRDVLLSGGWGRLRVLGPARSPPPRASTNDACLVLLVETPHGSVLLAGDREAPGVDALLGAHPDLRADVLVLPHHGHPSRGLERLVRATTPSVRLASCPPSAVAALPPGTRSTATEGAIRVVLAAEGPRVERVVGGRRDDRGYDPPRDDASRPMADSSTLLVAAVALLAVAAVATRLRWLSPAGSAGAALLGFAAVSAFRWAGLAGLLAPFLVATLLGTLPGGTESGPRSLRQVAANGLPAVVGIALAWAGRPAAGARAFAGALAALGADTVATEVGTRFGGVARDAVTFRPVERGASGGVTAAGTLASVGGSVLAPAALLATGALQGVAAAAATAAAGVAAGLVDSVLGSSLQRRGTCPTCGATVESAAHCGAAVPTRRGRFAFLDNDVVNVANGLVGAGLAVVLPWGSA